MDRSISSSKASTRKVDILYEKGGFEKFWEDLKQITFDVMFVLLREEDDVNLYYTVLNTVVDYAQMLGFPFNKQINNVWKASDFLAYIFEVFNFFSIAA
jgi:hypothetical protein